MPLTRVSLALIAMLLMGYAFLDKGFAYLGFWPVFIGEIVFAIVFLLTLITGTNIQFLRSPICQALLIFVSWETIILIFHSKGTWVNALRDSVTWSYAAFSLLIAGLVLRSDAVGLTLNWYGRWMPWFAILSAPLFVMADRLANVLPTFPGTTLPIMNIKAGDFGVHLAGAVVFLALGLHREFPPQKGNWMGFKDIILVSFMALGVVAIGSRNRGGLLSVVLAVVVCFLVRPNNRLGRFILPVAVVVFLLSAFDVSIPTTYREISVNQILRNVGSVVFDERSNSLSETVNWRLEWWEGIIDKVLHGDGFWHGSGFGESLAAKYGFSDGTGNRSPHDAHLTILARSGVPGLFLWFAFILTTYAILLREYVSAMMRKQVTLAKVDLWIMAYFTAFLVNMSFDVYLEGPQGGIWFWSLVGFAIAVTRAQRVNRTVAREVRAAPEYRTTAAKPYGQTRYRRPT